VAPQDHRQVVQTQTTRDRGPDQVLIWRRDQLVRSGVPPSLAARAAMDGGYDLHVFVELLGRGCPPELAIRILAPLESDMPATTFDVAAIRTGRELR
jgi:hypothetical protein